MESFSKFKEFPRDTPPDDFKSEIQESELKPSNLSELDYKEPEPVQLTEEELKTPTRLVDLSFFNVGNAAEIMKTVEKSNADGDKITTIDYSVTSGITESCLMQIIERRIDEKINDAINQIFQKNGL